MNQYFLNYHRKIISKPILIVLLVVILSACQGIPRHQAYSGSQKATTEIATLYFPEEFKILFINKEKYSSSILGSGAIMELLPGTHQFLFMYDDIWDLTGEEHERVKSNPISLTINASAGQEYKIKYKKPENVNEARSYAKHPSIEIHNITTNTTMSANIEYNIYTESFFSKLIGINIPANNNQTDSGQTNDALNMLKYWWESASDNQKKAFQEWVTK